MLADLPGRSCGNPPEKIRNVSLFFPTTQYKKKRVENRMYNLIRNVVYSRLPALR